MRDELCVARLDRLIIRCWPPRNAKIPSIKGFRVVRDLRPRSQAEVQTYERVRTLQSFTSGAQVYWQYRPQQPWLAPWRIQLVPKDRNGLAATDIRPIVKHGRNYVFTLVEFALDFDPLIGMDRRFVKRHAVFGKSRYRKDRGGPEQLRYGTRKSGKLVRCYWKPPLHAYRVEVELHSRILNAWQIETMDDLIHLPTVIFPKHLAFMRLSWRRLWRYLRRRYGERACGIVSASKRKSHISLRRSMRYLEGKGVKNVHRFLKPMSVNALVRKALNKWSANFDRGLK